MPFEALCGSVLPSFGECYGNGAGKPRIIACAEDFPKYIGLPRGCADEAVQLLKSFGIKTHIDDKRNNGEALAARFLGELLPEQKRATKAMLAHETGVLAATTAFGKTVVAAHIIAERKTNTLVLVHRRQLIIATGRYIGEGFDDARLDTLFLAMPISWHGTLAQYAGRLHRLHHAKKQVIIYDYVDAAIPMLSKMAEKRVKGYERLGYQIGS